MRRALLALGLILACITQALALAGQQRTVMMQPPGWVLQGQPVSMDWARGRYWAPGMGYTGPLVLTTTTRASTKYCQMLSGIWQTTGVNNYPAICDQGVLPEEARTNDALWSRDTTQAGSWTLVGDTTALNAVGIDGQANSASTLTATGTAGSCTASCTALQSITLASSADTYSVWLKRVTGSGAVNITINNLAGTTACTLVTTAFTRCSVTATLANPVIGIQMTTVGDVIVADFNQMEPGGFTTSPILTTTVAATRAADNMKAIGPFKIAAGSIAGAMLVVAGPLNNSNAMFFSRDSSQNIPFWAQGATVVKVLAANVSNAGTLGGSNSWLIGTNKMAMGWSAAGTSVIGDGGTVAVAATAFSGSISTGQFGSFDGSANYPDGHISSFNVFPYRLIDAQLQGISK